MREQKDFGLLILRGAGLLLALTFGVQKIGWYWSALHAGKSFSSIGLAPLIAKMGFPIPAALAISSETTKMVVFQSTVKNGLRAGHLQKFINRSLFTDHGSLR